MSEQIGATDAPIGGPASSRPGRTELQLRFRLWGKDLDPAAVTSRTGVEPHKSFLVGERRGRAANVVAAWEWWSQTWTDSDTDALFDLMVTVLGPHRELFRDAVDRGAVGTLTIVGFVYGEVISSPEEAERRQLHAHGDPFEPELWSDRVAIGLSREVIEFLAAAGFSFDTHIDAALDDEAAH